MNSPQGQPENSLADRLKQRDAEERAASTRSHRKVRELFALVSFVGAMAVATEAHGWPRYVLAFLLGVPAWLALTDPDRDQW